MMLFETKRLRIRPLIDSDLEGLMGAYGDLDAMRYVGDGTALSAEDCKRWIEITHNNYKVLGYGMACITLKESGEAVGFCGLTHPGNQKDPEYKYTLHRRFWNLGIATEAGCAMVAYAQGELGLPRIIATVDAAHVASHKVLRKCGFKHESTSSEEDGSEVALWSITTQS